ncbi:unnamed protein product (macronuclear) [Paramecium tetraurelia]|uniref:FCP1 homology domain-containing protein n=1 Tax=Paramecium tetraurelia TaxID=5888 RepID=A0CIJ0_PARTE|nr:uncharacterized protein GSPATT00007742001 [Paramecium tetraurelia]CAK70607.1 unnamed protein product [Paramecium tetraurelia]|eukprot:XP_001438004.1 hypothetical protein (macronuclear) [Paramecium tetraurelia strain d4-2]
MYDIALISQESQQENKEAYLENHKKFSEQSSLKTDYLSSDCHQQKNQQWMHKSSSLTQIYPSLDDNLTCISQTSSVISVKEPKIPIETNKKIKKRKNHAHRNLKTAVSRKQIEMKCQTEKRPEKSTGQLLHYLHEKDVKIPIPSIETIIQQEALLSEQILSYSNYQYYMHNLIGYLMGSLKDSFMAQMYINHFSQLYSNLQKSKLIVCPQQYSFSIKIQPQKKIQKTLIIDLDETLVHCNEFSCLKSDFFIPLVYGDKSFQVGISIRPHAQQFLRNMAKVYEIIVFTASNPDYANKIIDYLDPEQNLVSYRLFRDDCIQISNNCHIKDLRILNRNMQDIVLVDNSAYSFAFQIDNGIPIIPYLDNKNDKELLHLENYLHYVNQFDDVRSQNNKMFNLKIVQNCISIAEAIKCLAASISK